MPSALNVRPGTLEDFLAWEREQPQRYERATSRQFCWSRWICRIASERSC
jgi:hypothetical protein